MPAKLRDVTRAFGRGETTLESLRGAALAERNDRQLADQILQLITAWETSAWKDSARSRGDLRDRVGQLIPPDPPTPPVAASSRKPGESIYEAGLRGQKRRS